MSGGGMWICMVLGVAGLWVLAWCAIRWAIGTRRPGSAPRKLLSHSTCSMPDWTPEVTAEEYLRVRQFLPPASSRPSWKYETSTDDSPTVDRGPSGGAGDGAGDRDSTGIIQTDFYHRMTPVLWWNYPVWVMSSILSGALVATYVRDPDVVIPPTQRGSTFAGNVLSLFAVGCPICNKLVVIAIGVSGALNWFAPIQPILALASLTLLAYAFWRAGGRR